MGQQWPDGYSAQVDIYLIVDGERYDVAQVANGSLVMRDPRPIPPETVATLVLDIDGKNESKEIFLRDGVADSNGFIPYF